MYLARYYCMLEHAADSSSQCPALSLQQSLHTALGRHQQQVRQMPVTMETKQLIAKHCHVHDIWAKLRRQVLTNTQI